LLQVLAQLATAPPSAELSSRMGIADAAQLNAELQTYLVTRRALLANTEQRYRALTGNDIDMGEAKLGIFGKINGDVPSPMFVRPLQPLPYRLGYSWQMRMVDVLAQKTSDYTHSVTQLLPQGYIEINGGAVVLDSDGDIRVHDTAERKRSFNLHYRQHPSILRRGNEHTFGYTITDTLPDGKVFTQQGSKASMTSVAPEPVEVPAGKFDTWRIERRSNWAGVESGISGTFSQTAWYSPTLRRHVKWEDISRNAAGAVVRHERHELLKTD
jgi:hypothetical protein